VERAEPPETGLDPSDDGSSRVYPRRGPVARKVTAFHELVVATLARYDFE
jgi:hypothetical protein